MDDLENLRKRAKHLVRQHRDGVHAVAERIRRGLPRFAGMSDREVLDASFALHDAQQLVAAELGVGSWAALKEARPMTTTTPVEERVERATACLFVVDFERALSFYRDKLGFEVVFTYGSPPFWGEIRRDTALLNLRHVDESPWIEGVREHDELSAAYVLTTDAKPLFLEFDERGVDFFERLQRKPWDMNQFVVRDPDGNLVVFGSRL